MVPSVYLKTQHNTAEVLELHPSSGEDSEPDDAVPQIPAISSLQIGDNVLSMDPSLICLDPRVPGLISSHIAFIVFFIYIRAKNCPSMCHCWKIFGYETRFSHHAIFTMCSSSLKLMLLPIHR
jgi:hypothetical protein